MPELPARQWVSAGKQAPGSAEPTVGLSSFTPLPNPVLSPRQTVLSALEATEAKGRNLPLLSSSS